MRFRFRILSANKRRQRDVRNFGLLLLIVGIHLHDPGQTSLKFLGVLMLLWSGMSRLALKAWSKGWLMDSVWVHASALVLLIVLDGQVGHIIRITENAIVTFSDQILQRALPLPPEKPEPIAKFEHGDTIHSIAFSPVDASLLASAGGDTIKLWDQNAPDNPTILRLEPYTHDVETLWNVPEKRFSHTFAYDTAAVAFSPDGQRMTDAAWDLNLWDIRDNNNPKQIPFSNTSHTTLLCNLLPFLRMENGLYPGTLKVI